MMPNRDCKLWHETALACRSDWQRDRRSSKWSGVMDMVISRVLNVILRKTMHMEGCSLGGFGRSTKGGLLQRN